MARLISFIVLAAIIVLFAVLFFQVMAQFLLPMFLAVILVVMFRPVHQWFIIKCGGRVRTAAGLTTLAILIIVLAPMISILILATNDAIEVIQKLDPALLVAKIEKLRHNLNLDFGLDINEVKKLPEIESHLDELVAAIVASDSKEKQEESVDRLSGLLDAEFRSLEKSLAAEPGAQQGNQPIPRDNSDPRAMLRQMRSDLADLKRQVEAVPEAAPVAAKSAMSRDELLGEQADKLKEAYYSFKNQVVGGPLLENLRLWANPTPDDITNARTSFVDWLQTYALETGTFLGGFLANFAIGLAVLIISLYYFLADGPAMIATIMRLLPLDDRYERQLLDEFDRISRAVVLATLLSALVQGLLAGVGFFAVGLGAVFLLTVVTMLMALVPFVGAAAVWGTCAVWLLVFDEKVGAAIALAIYGVCIVSMADNVIKPIVLHGQSKLHPLLALLSVLGGVRALGPIGIFVGPMAIALLQALLNILNTELTALSQRAPALHAPE